jgi:prepilin-type N-terminal cleavage/methylation domain-containing protein
MAVTDAPAGRSAAGFTLAEVLVAVTVLAVGLLALQALGVSAARATAGASRESQVVSAAMHHLEAAYGDLASGRLPPPLSCTLGNGDRVTRTAAVIGPGTLAEVEVEVVPGFVGPAAAPFTLRAHVFSHTGFGPAPAPAPCP